MPISYSGVGRNILSALTQGANMSMPQPWLGLFSTMPSANGSGGVQVSYPEYGKVRIDNPGIEGKEIMGEPYSETDTDGNILSAVKNQEIIYFPENETGSAVQAVGWGLFSSASATTPYMWGELKTPVTINKNSVPMFRVDDFVMKLK